MASEHGAANSPQPTAEPMAGHSPQPTAVAGHTPTESDLHQKQTHAQHSTFLVPSPVPTRRNRTQSQSERALKAPELRGVIKSFCRQKGHGFITPEDGSDALFVHISDIDEDYVPVAGDVVTFRTINIPPRNEKQQACHVRIAHLNPRVPHQRWDSQQQHSPQQHSTLHSSQHSPCSGDS